MSRKRIVIYDRKGDTYEAEFIRLLSAEAYGGDRNRPYNGQAHTDLGKRGKTLVVGLTMRDIADYIRRGQVLACPPDSDDFDLIAAIQNAMCEVERMMGIFPNIDPKEPIVIPVFEVDLGSKRKP